MYDLYDTKNLYDFLKDTLDEFYGKETVSVDNLGDIDINEKENDIGVELNYSQYGDYISSPLNEYILYLRKQKIKQILNGQLH